GSPAAVSSRRRRADGESPRTGREEASARSARLAAAETRPRAAPRPAREARDETIQVRSFEAAMQAATQAATADKDASELAAFRARRGPVAGSATGRRPGATGRLHTATLRPRCRTSVVPSRARQAPPTAIRTSAEAAQPVT